MSNLERLLCLSCAVIIVFFIAQASDSLKEADARHAHRADALRLEQQLKTLIIKHGELSAPCVDARDLEHYSLSISQDSEKLTVRVTGGPSK